MKIEKLKEVIVDQQAFFSQKKDLLKRDGDFSSLLKTEDIVAIIGARRAGKSSLLHIFSHEIKTPFLYLHFDDIRLIDFSIDNCTDAENIASQLYPSQEKITFFLDEIQNIPSWERWVNTLHMKGHKVFITGSNSNLLSSELSTFLTGRHRSISLYPFSFREFILYKQEKIPENIDLSTSQQKNLILSLFFKYIKIGGFPQAVKENDYQVTRQYFSDSIEKDIFNRYAIRDRKEIKDMALFLATNSGEKVSYSTLKNITGIKSVGTVKNYLEHLKSTFLFMGISLYDFSLKRQQINSQKIYSLDTGMIHSVAFNFSENKGKMLEHLVFLELKRRGAEVYYHHKNGECDFVIKSGYSISHAYQVSVSLEDQKTKDREIKGLLSALHEYSLDEGFIITEQEEYVFEKDKKKIHVLPFWKWALTR